MELNFEAKYICIVWKNKNEAASIKESDDVIPIDIINHTECQLDAITYSKINESKFGQIAFRIKDDSIKSIPFFAVDYGKKELRPVKDNLTGKIWWIESGEWSGANSRWQSEMFRSVGMVDLYIGGFKCTIYISTSSFTYKELELYLQDFKNDFWELILSESNHIQAKAKNTTTKILDKSSIEHINKFIEFASKVIANPKKELREIQSLQDYKKVRPVPRTFMEIATKGQKKQLTSRSYKESYNIAENKYIFHLINRIEELLKNITKVTNKTSEFQSKKINDYENRLNSFHNFKIIDKDTLYNEIEDIEREIINDNVQLKEALIRQNHKMNIYPLKQESIIIKLGKRTTHHHEFIFFGDAKKNMEDCYYLENNKNGVYYWFCFDKSLFDGKLKEGREYEILGYINKTNTDKQYRRDFIYISNIKIINSNLNKSLEKLLLEKDKLESTNWRRDLTKSEQAEQKNEKSSIRKTIELSQKQQELNAFLTKEFEPLLSKLTILKNKFWKLKIQPDSYFPNSMTFIQNPNYQGVHKLYKKIVNLSGLDEDLFLALIEIEKIGILNISLIYERWCLLQIIKILVDTYHFLPEEDWKNKLIKQTLGLGKNIEIKFESNTLGRKITLWYEKVLLSRKRPDFVLDVTSSFNNDDTVHRLVMDAKFYEDINNRFGGGISTVIGKLYNKKNYSEDNKNTVFILHPSKNAVLKKQTPQEWAKNSYYGETQMFDWDENKPNHKYGAVFLSPIRDGNYLDDLQRLIGMFLQYSIEDNFNIQSDDKKFDPIVKQFLCLVCGSTLCDCNKINTKSGYGYIYLVKCAKCFHKSEYNYCWNCHHRLIKNGSYWTYHAMKALEPDNIKCPYCGELRYWL